MGGRGGERSGNGMEYNGMEEREDQEEIDRGGERKEGMSKVEGGRGGGLKLKHRPANPQSIQSYQPIF